MKRKRSSILVYNDGRLEQEKIVAEAWMRLIYVNPVGRATLPFLVKRKALSRLYGMYCRTPRSARMIPKFIEQNKVDMTGFDGPYGSFTEFFSREKKDVAFPAEPHLLGSPCEGMASVFTDIRADHMIAAKGEAYQLAELFGDKALAAKYEGGTLLRIRLTPANYHRVHSFDEGTVTSTRLLKGHLYSVSPLALGRIARLYCRNKRALTQFATCNFGDVVLVEVGATFVGSIVHCFKAGEALNRKQQVSYFQPGGSLLLVFFEKGAFVPDETLRQRSAEGYETMVKIGEALGTANGGLS
jgi:phosphatidylserine decarboxylase